MVFSENALTRSTSSSHLFLLASARRSFCNRVSFGARAGPSLSESSEPAMYARRSSHGPNLEGGLDGVQGSSKAARHARACQHLGSAVLIIIAITCQGHQIGREFDSHAARRCSCRKCPLCHSEHAPSRGIRNDCRLTRQAIYLREAFLKGSLGSTGAIAFTHIHDEAYTPVGCMEPILRSRHT